MGSRPSMGSGESDKLHSPVKPCSRSDTVRITQATHNESLMSRCPAVCGQDWDGSHLIGGQALIRSHGPPRVGGWGRQVIIRTASAMRQPVDWVRPHPDLKGLRVGARTVSLLPIASGKQGGIHHCHTEWGPTSLDSISSTGVSPSDRMRGHTAHRIEVCAYWWGWSGF